MPAKSKAQQRFFGMVRAAQKGEMENPSKEVSDVASDISMKDAKKFAKTKHKGLPEKKKEVVTEADKKGKGSGKKDACYHKVKASAKVWPSAYASGRLVQCRKKGAGNYGKSKSESYSWRDDVTEGSLHKWFNSSKSKDGKKGWVQSDGSPCANEPGETKTPKCYSSSKRASMSKKELRSADARKSRQDPNQQQKSGAAKPTYVSTDKPKKKKVNEAAAWTKKSGKNKEGGLNEKGRKSYERENPGSDLKAPQPEGGSRKKSFCARMGGMKKKLTSAKTANDPDSRINKSLRKWKCNEEKIEEVAFLAGLAKGAAVAAKGMAKGAVKQKAKQAVKQKAAEVAGNVADKISKPIGGTRVQESKGTAELAGLALRGKKRCAECGSFTHVTGDCPKKEHGLVNKRTVTSEAKERHPRDQKELDRAQAYIKKNPNFGRERGKKDQAELDRAQAYIKKNPNFGVKEAKEEEGRSDYGKASVRNKRRFGKEGKPAVIDPTNERGKMIDKRREEHQQRQVKYEGVMDIVKRYTDKKKPEKKPEKAMDAGARAKRQLARKVHAKYVSGSTENVPDDIRDHKTWNDFKTHIN